MRSVKHKSTRNRIDAKKANSNRVDDKRVGGMSNNSALKVMTGDNLIVLFWSQQETRSYRTMIMVLHMRRVWN